MSIKHINMALDTEYQPTTKIILFVLADYADENGECYPSWKKIMQRTSVKNRHTVARHLKILEADGVITRERRFDNSNIYRLFIENAPSTENAPGISNDTTLVIPDSTTLVIPDSTLTTNEPPKNHKGKLPVKKPRGYVYPDSFTDIWNGYKHGDKWNAYRAYSHRIKEGYSQDEIIKAISLENKKDFGKRHFSTVLNGDIDECVGTAVVPKRSSVQCH